MSITKTREVFSLPNVHYASIYIRHCGSKENMEVHIKRVSTFIPAYGKVGIMGITDKQFEEIKLFYGKKPQKPNAPGAQLELF